MSNTTRIIVRISLVLLVALALGIFMQSQEGAVAQKTNDSLYAGRVQLHSLKGGSDANPNYEYVTLEVTGEAGDPIVISGWTLISTQGSIRIPEGVVLFKQGGVGTQQPISLYPGESVLLSFGRSPVGVSFRENVCVQLLGKFQTFVPPLASTSTQGVQGFYNDCVSSRSSEEGFMLPYWRAFANATSSILGHGDESELSLLDETGALVSTISLAR